MDESIESSLHLCHNSFKWFQHRQLWVSLMNGRITGNGSGNCVLNFYCQRNSPGRQTGTYPQQTVSYVSHYLVHLICRGQLQRERATLILYEQLERHVYQYNSSEELHLSAEFSSVWKTNAVKAETSTTRMHLYLVVCIRMVAGANLSLHHLFPCTHWIPRNNLHKTNNSTRLH